MPRNYTKHLANVLQNIDYKDHVVEYDSDLVNRDLEFYSADLDFEELVKELIEEEVKINMIKGYDNDIHEHRKIDYYDMICTSGAEYFKSFIKHYSSHQVFKIVEKKIRCNSITTGKISFKTYRIYLRYKYVKKFYQYLLDSGDLNKDENPAQIITEEVPFLIEDKSTQWLLDQEPLYIEKLDMLSSSVILDYRKKQVNAFKETIRNALCFDVVDLISTNVLKDITKAIENESKARSDSDSD